MGENSIYFIQISMASSIIMIFLKFFIDSFKAVCYNTEYVRRLCVSVICFRVAYPVRKNHRLEAVWLEENMYPTTVWKRI